MIDRLASWFYRLRSTSSTQGTSEDFASDVGANLPAVKPQYLKNGFLYRCMTPFRLGTDRGIVDLDNIDAMMEEVRDRNEKLHELKQTRSKLDFEIADAQARVSLMRLRIDEVRIRVLSDTYGTGSRGDGQVPIVDGDHQYGKPSLEQAHAAGRQVLNRRHAAWAAFKKRHPSTMKVLQSLDLAMKVKP